MDSGPATNGAATATPEAPNNSGVEAAVTATVMSAMKSHIRDAVQTELNKLVPASLQQSSSTSQVLEQSAPVLAVGSHTVQPQTATQRPSTWTPQNTGGGNVTPVDVATTTPIYNTDTTHGSNTEQGLSASVFGHGPNPVSVASAASASGFGSGRGRFLLGR